MERVTIFSRTTKDKGKIRLRFRLTDGRDVQLYHKSDIEADLNDLKKFNIDGTRKPKVTVCNEKLLNAIAEEIAIVKKVYSEMVNNGLAINSDNLEKLIDRTKHPMAFQEKEPTLLSRFEKFIESIYRDGVIGEGRLKHYQVTQRELERFLIIKSSDGITAKEFNEEMLMEYRHFLINEYSFVGKWQGLYVGLKEMNIPKQKRSLNTVAQKLNQLQAFFTTMEDREIIVKSPFRKLGKKKKASALKEEYDEPIYLTGEEFQRVMNKDVPNTLQETKDAFLLQSALGCRISDFKAMTMDNIAITDNGIPYIRYLPIKTKEVTKEAVETPLMLFALEIVKKYDFSFHILRYVSGEHGYNSKIKDLLQFCEIDRECRVFDAEDDDNVYKPLYELGSSKICRKTHIDIMNKVQINQYVAGLHREGSKVVNRYTNLTLEDRFVLMCEAFSQPMYKVNKNCDIIK